MPPFAAPFLAAIALAIAARGAPQANAADPAMTVPVMLDTHGDVFGRLTLPVSIGEQGPFRFLIDTAAERSAVSRAVATRLGLAASTPVIVVGVAGQKVVDTVDLGGIRFGGVRYEGGGAPVLEEGDLGADGIVGLDGLADHRVLFDFAHKRVALVDPHSAEGRERFDIVVSARRRGNQLIMTDAVIDGVRTDIVIDTGSETSIGNRALRRALAQRAANDMTMIESVTGQEIKAEYAMIHELAIGRIAINNPLVTYADAPTFAALKLEKHPALLLGMRDLRMFRRFAIDFASKRILFDMPS